MRRVRTPESAAKGRRAGQVAGAVGGCWTSVTCLTSWVAVDLNVGAEACARKRDVAASARRQVLDDMRTSGAAPVSVVGDHRQLLGLLTPQNVAEMMMIKQVKLDWRFGR